jgi:Small subunit of phenylpropionate dioxygenase
MRDMNSRRENNSLDERIGKLLLEREVEDFIAREAAMLDEWRLDEWLGLFTDDGRYSGPVYRYPRWRSERNFGHHQ